MVPENLYLIQKRLIYLKQLLRYEKIGLYGGHFPKWPPTPSRAKSEMALYPNMFVMMKSKCVSNVMLVSQNAQFGHIFSHIGWANSESERGANRSVHLYLL